MIELDDLSDSDDDDQGGGLHIEALGTMEITLLDTQTIDFSRGNDAYDSIVDLQPLSDSE